MKTFKDKMDKISDQLGLTYDGGTDDRLFVEEMVRVDVRQMSEVEYDDMETYLNSNEIVGDGFVIYAWNDCSGYDYWLDQSESFDFNYIQVTVSINNIDLVDIEELDIQLEKFKNNVSSYDNIDTADFSRKEA